MSNKADDLVVKMVTAVAMIDLVYRLVKPRNTEEESTDE